MFHLIHLLTNPLPGVEAMNHAAVILLAVFNGYMYLIHLPMLVMEIWA